MLFTVIISKKFKTIYIMTTVYNISPIYFTSSAYNIKHCYYFATFEDYYYLREEEGFSRFFQKIKSAGNARLLSSRLADSALA